MTSAVLDDEVVVKDGVISLELEVKSPTMAVEADLDNVVVIHSRPFVPPMLVVDVHPVVLELLVMVDVFAEFPFRSEICNGN